MQSDTRGQAEGGEGDGGEQGRAREMTIDTYLCPTKYWFYCWHSPLYAVNKVDHV